MGHMINGCFNPTSRPITRAQGLLIELAIILPWEFFLKIDRFGAFIGGQVFAAKGDEGGFKIGTDH